MRNYINQKLVVHRGVGDKEVAELNCLHYLADAILIRVQNTLSCNGDRLHEGVAEAFEAMKFVEYEMQKRWGFAQSEREHTHKHRLKNIIGE
jgi:hypothetical protein